MPGAPREDVFDPEVVGIYHCYNRCSQRAFLCGFDPVTQQDFSHRKQWVQDRLKLLARGMAVEILDYAVLDNHLHCVLRNRPDLVGTWPDEEVVRRWWLLCPDRRDERGEPAEISNIELQARLADHEQVAEYRKRLSCISWFMRLLCQPIARRANHESDVTGRFFAHRFGCERILDTAGLLACSMYVDLNLVRAGVAKTPEESVYTSAYDRIRGHMFRQAQSLDQDATEILDSEGPDDWLAPLSLDQQTDAYLDAAASGNGQADLAEDTGVTNESPEETQVEPSSGKLPASTSYHSTQLHPPPASNELEAAPRTSRSPSKSHRRDYRPPNSRGRRPAYSPAHQTCHLVILKPPESMVASSAKKNIEIVVLVDIS